MSTTILHGQMTNVDKNGNVQVLYHENTASDVLVDRSTNIQGTSGTSAIPSDVNTLQKLANKLGKLAFKSSIESADLAFGFVVNNFTTTKTGSALDAVAGKNLNDRLTTIEDADLLVIGTDAESGDYAIPESEINDGVTSVASTWSSTKIADYINNVSDNFYIDLRETADEGYTTTVTLAEIEEAYQKGKFLWITANDLHLPLRVRNSATEWVFSGYADGQACDIKINSAGVTVTYTAVASADKLQGVETVYDTETGMVNFI